MDSPTNRKVSNGKRSPAVMRLNLDSDRRITPKKKKTPDERTIEGLVGDTSNAEVADEKLDFTPLSEDEYDTYNKSINNDAKRTNASLVSIPLNRGSSNGSTELGTQELKYKIDAKLVVNNLKNHFSHRVVGFLKENWKFILLGAAIAFTFSYIFFPALVVALKALSLPVIELDLIEFGYFTLSGLVGVALGASVAYITKKCLCPPIESVDFENLKKEKETQEPPSSSPRNSTTGLSELFIIQPWAHAANTSNTSDRADTPRSDQQPATHPSIPQDTYPHQAQPYTPSPPK